MDWEQKLMALKSLSPGIALSMRKPGNWYVSASHIEISNGVTLCSPIESEATPEEAVNARWLRLTELQPGGCLVINAMNDKRRAIKWNGYMWEDVDEV